MSCPETAFRESHSTNSRWASTIWFGLNGKSVSTLVAVGPHYFVGDDANQNPKLPSYAIVNLHTSYQINSNITVFAHINNLLDKKYALFGTYFDPEGTSKAGLPILLTNRRTEVPGQPFAIYGGIRMKL